MTDASTQQKMLAWQRSAEPQAPKPGDLAPDFALVELDSRTRIRLSDFFWEKPVALIFGSHT